MKEQIKLLKQELKQLAKTIREQKKQRKGAEFGWVPGLLELRQYARHRHVLYCLARGRELEQVDSGVGLNMDYINFHLDAMKNQDKKLYVVVDSKLRVSQQAVQACHAVAEFVKNNPYTTWTNGTIVLLKEEMRGYFYGRFFPNEFAQFHEPDLDNKMTAYVMYGPNLEDRMKNKPLV